MRKINILPIYEENIIGFVYDGVNAQFKYRSERKTINLNFSFVLFFDFCDFEYQSDVEWEFGLVEYEHSPRLNEIFSRINNPIFNKGLENLYHYKLVIDDVGIYNIICKAFFEQQE